MAAILPTLMFAITAIGGLVAVLGVVLTLAGGVTIVSGRTIAPELTRTTSASTPGAARAVGFLWAALGVAFVVFGLSS